MRGRECVRLDPRSRLPSLAQRLQLCGIGLLLGTLFFAASLTPSLIPRSYAIQGVLAGVSFAIGYVLGVSWRWLWRYLELPEPNDRLRVVTTSVLALLCLGVAVWFLWRSADWQNSVRAVVGMAPVEGGHALKVCLISIATFLILLGLARAFWLLAGWLSGVTGSLVPRRVAKAAGVGAAAVLFWMVASDILVRSLLNILDASYREFNELIEPERPQPLDPTRTGSPASLVDWSDLGRAGREFIAETPAAAEITALTGRVAQTPVRVYVGLPSEEDHVERARLALEELKRIGGFQRSRLVIITPTGTGWVDPSAMAAIEYLSDGDVASVALQYSYLSSPLSLLTEPGYGSEAAQALFREVYRHWTGLPPEARPELYLHGLSLGAMNSERSAELFEILADPIDGALWSGPPFQSRIWRRITEWRNPGSPQWLPEFRDGSLVRFMNQDGSRIPPTRPWGALRVVYLQYASDPIVFFDYRDLYRRPDWMVSPTGPDVSAKLRWYPVVTMLQLAVDMAFATDTPIGYGHVYAPEDYAAAWTAVANISDWPEERLAFVRERLAEELRSRRD